LAGRKFHLFLDFDGTLTPVRKRPELAQLSAEMSAKLIALKSFIPVAIVSGRDRDDVINLVGVEDLFYAGCHGFDIQDPRLATLPELDGQCSQEDIKVLGSSIANSIEKFDGIVLKIKKWAVAIHYRTLTPTQSESLEAIVKNIVSPLSKFRIGQGDKVIEVTPNVAWDKGKAVLWLGSQLTHLYGAGVAIYIGDDTTDEDAFHALDRNGLSILVAERPRLTSAAYRLKSPEEVGWFLDQLLCLLRHS
tara:strand:+ start:323 stop:1066 length:744 start_codon:yes stop_codon:yes gene_type:complete